MGSSLSITGLLSITILATAVAWGQKTSFVSPLDESVTLRALAFCPIVDNVKDIYAQPVTEELRRQLESSRRWKIQPCPEKARGTLEDFEESPAKTQALLKAAHAEGLVTGRVSRGPSGLSVRLGLFVGPEGLPWSISGVTETEMFEINDVKKLAKAQLDKVLASLPYEVLVVSRRGQVVTIDRGSDHGLKNDEELQVIQITAIKRHPKFGFVVGVEKAIMGTIKLQKVEETLSFGTILSERTEGQIISGFKAVSQKFIRYAETPLSGDGKLQEPLGQRKYRDVSIGENPGEWAPQASDEAPAFGALALLFGFGNYDISNALSTSGGVTGSASPSPSIHLGGEIWVTANWIAQLDILQHVAKVSNGLSGSTPGTLNVQTRELQLAGAYRLWFGEGPQSPRLDVSLGMNQMSGYVDDSAPKAFTSVNFGGFYLGFAGAFPVDLEDGRKMMMGGRFNYVMNATLSESPVTSGASSNATISQFAVFADYPWKPRVHWLGELRFHQYGANLSGAGTRTENATSISHSTTSLAFGAAFLF